MSSAPQHASDHHRSDLRDGADLPASFGEGRYLVERVLGEGSQKRVFLVRDTALDRQCALALLRAEGVDDESRARVRREARAMGRAGGHPNLVTVFDIADDADGTPYIVSEYVDRGDLRRRIAQAAEGRLSVDDALSIAEDLAAALVAVHALGIVHRDVKPANIWLSEDGTAKLGDFGLAAVGRSRITQTGAVLGTATYMAPEQALGGDVDARSDLYALGTVIYEMLAGRPPFLGSDSLAVLSQHLNTAPVAPSWHNNEIPPRLESLTLSLLAKVPDDRPASAVAVLNELRQIVQERILAPDPPDIQQLRSGGDLQLLAWGEFVGRHDELDQLKRAVDTMLSGRGTVVLIAGEPGIGKTSLAREMTVYARLRGAQVLSGRCDEQGGAIPYRPLVEALRQYVRQHADAQVLGEIGSGAPDIAALISGIRDRLTSGQQRDPADGEAERLQLFDSVTHFLRNACVASPIVLFFDDLQWSDKSSLMFLRHLAREINSDRILVVGTYRDVELDRHHPLSDVIAALRREPSYQRVLLRGLTEENVTDLLTAIEPSGAVADGRGALASILFHETEGNPFFIREILTHLVEEGKLYRKDGHWTSDAESSSQLGIPEGVREVVGRRISRLSDDCQKILTTASALAGGFTWSVLQAVSRLDEGAVLDLLDEALAAQLVAERRSDQPGAFDFTHSLIRQTLYDALSTPRRVLLHERIAATLEEFYASNLDAHLPELANHYYQAAHGGRSIRKAIEYARRAAARAVGQFAYEESIAQNERALELLELEDAPDANTEIEILLDLTDQFWNSGEFVKARATSVRAANLAAETGAGDLMARAAIAYSSNEPISFNIGFVDTDELDLLERALAAAGSDDKLRALLMSRLAERLSFAGQDARRRALARDAVALARTTGDVEVLRRTIAGAGVALREPSLFPERLAFGRELGELSAQLPDARRAMSALSQAVDSLEAGDIAAVRRSFASVDAWAQRSRRPYELWLAACWNVSEALFQGRFADAEREMQRALAMGLSDQNQNATGVFGAQLFFLRREQGRLSEIQPALRGFIEQYPLIRAWRCGLVSLHVELGEVDAARLALDAVAAHDFQDIPPDLVWLLSVSVLCEAAYRLADQRRSAQLLDLILPYADRNVPATPLGPCLGSGAYYVALASAGAGALDDAEPLFRQAIAENERMGMPVWVARCRADYAELLVRRGADGDVANAASLVAAGLLTARALEMTSLARRLATLEAGIAASVNADE